jgi:hypothetical protein
VRALHISPIPDRYILCIAMGVCLLLLAVYNMRKNPEAFMVRSRTF